MGAVNFIVYLREFMERQSMIDILSGHFEIEYLNNLDNRQLVNLYNEYIEYYSELDWK